MEARRPRQAVAAGNWLRKIPVPRSRARVSAHPPALLYDDIGLSIEIEGDVARDVLYCGASIVGKML